MVSRRKSEPEPKASRHRPATTPEGRENQLVSLAVERAEQQLRDGTASAQVITHYLKLGSPRERLERDRLAAENALLQAKIESMASGHRMEELYAKAIQSMRQYRGEEVMEDDDGYD